MLLVGLLLYYLVKASSIVNNELSAASPTIAIDWSRLNGSLRQAKSERDSNCWSSPSGNGFMIRGKTYLTDRSKVCWFSVRMLLLSYF